MTPAMLPRYMEGTSIPAEPPDAMVLMVASNFPTRATAAIQMVNWPVSAAAITRSLVPRTRSSDSPVSQAAVSPMTPVMTAPTTWRCQGSAKRSWKKAERPPRTLRR